MQREKEVMARAIYTGDHWNAIDSNEQFTKEEVRRAALELLIGPSELIDYATIIVSAEWERSEAPSTTRLVRATSSKGMA